MSLVSPDNITLDPFTKFVTEIFKEIKAMDSVLDKNEYIDKKLSEKFRTRHYIVCKYMLYDKFCPSAFAWLIKNDQELLKLNPENDINVNKENYFKTQAEYARLLFKGCSDKGCINCGGIIPLSESKLKKIYEDNYNEIKTDYEAAIKINDQYKEVVNRKHKKQLMDFILKNKIYKN